MRTADTTERKRWLLAGATTMGIGIWSMHFTGMLRLPSLECRSSKTCPRLSISLAGLAIGAAAVALNVIYQRGVSWPRIIIGGVFMGAGIGVMHYVGMYAMRMEAHTRYDVRYFLLSRGRRRLRSPSSLSGSPRRAWTKTSTRRATWSPVRF